MQIFDAYIVGYNPKHTAQPFIHKLNIITMSKESIPVQANFNDGALINAMSITKFNNIKHRLGHYKPSFCWLRMANGAIVRAKVVWEGEIEIKGVRTRSSFEVFDSGDNWEFLFGKPLLVAFNAIHNYKNDRVTVESRGITVVLTNQIKNPKAKDDMGQPSKGETQENSVGNREEAPIHAVDNIYAEVPEGNTIALVYKITEKLEDNAPATIEIEIDTLKDNSNIFTRFTDPWKKEQVDKILEQVTIGPDLSEDKRGQVLTFISEWADIFALSVSEVKNVEDAVH